MLRKKIQAARPGDVSTGLVVAGAFIAMETVLRAGIDEKLDFRPPGLDDLDVGQGNAGILFAKMQLRRHFWLVVGEADDGATVIADCRRQARQFGRARIGDTAAEAEADDADRTAALYRIDRGLGVTQHLGPVGICDELARVGYFIRRVAALEIRLDAVEDRRRNRDIAGACQPVADRADVVIDAKDFLDHDDGRLGRASGIGAIGAQFESVRSRQCDVLSHGSSISCWGLHEVIGSEKRGKALIFGAWSFSIFGAWSFRKTGAHPASSAGQAFSGSCFIATSSCGPSRLSSRPACLCGTAGRAGP